LIIGAVTTIALSVVILFLILYFIFQGYAVEGHLEIPWLIDDTSTAPIPDADEEQDETSQFPEDPETTTPTSD